MNRSGNSQGDGGNCSNDDGNGRREEGVVRTVTVMIGCVP